MSHDALVEAGRPEVDYKNNTAWTLEAGSSSVADAFPPASVLKKYGLAEKSYELDVERLHRYRIARIQAAMDATDCDAVLLFDPVNIRYATGARNMQIWTMRHPGRYCLVLRTGRVILFEMGRRVHHAAGLPIVDEVRTAQPWFFYYAGPEAATHVRSFAGEVAEIVARSRARISIDRIDQQGLIALEESGLMPTDDAQKLMEHARSIKSEDEVTATRMAIDVCEAGIGRIRQELRPGISELSLWSVFHQTNIELGGEYIETRLLTSGPRTNPWHQEASHKEIQAGEMVTFDCDLIGPLGYGADLSRAFVCGRQPDATQKDLYRRALDQIMFNTELLQVGVSFSEIIEKACHLPDEYHQWHRVSHGNGMSTGEYPAIGRRPGFASGSIHQGHVEEGMVLCVGTFAGLKSGGEGVKLEHQLVIRANGPERLSSSLYDPDFCG
ncbi:M24 family metallopeptidase [Mesorhizobium sp. B4-1-4]|uniref:M24 family metallopeptidase n=1 Tax=Mesorhizobium sp. B4-1-4 TaxID=2589888 RepID=UPI00112D6F06|nr:Xaa-Pro peptidase family protein [Mesorhizobium sp. B4-1-4]UCI32035.1 Xaa-Pro peptidase family protein [Mesorhizobium sp. B4-1-4]